jgi:uncharacterized Tic20 family protein
VGTVQTGAWSVFVTWSGAVLDPDQLRGLAAYLARYQAVCSPLPDDQSSATLYVYGPDERYAVEAAVQAVQQACGALGLPCLVTNAGVMASSGRSWPGSPVGAWATPRPDTNLAMWAYLGSLLIWLGSLALSPLALLCVVPPLIIHNLDKAKRDPYVRFHTAQAINAALVGLISAVVGYVLASALGAVAGSQASTLEGAYQAGRGAGLIVVLVMFAYAIVRAVFVIIACIKAAQGETYRIPVWVAFPMVKP